MNQKTDTLNAEILELQRKLDDAQVAGDFERVEDIEIAIFIREDER